MSLFYVKNLCLHSCFFCYILDVSLSVNLSNKGGTLKPFIRELTKDYLAYAFLLQNKFSGRSPVIYLKDKTTNKICFSVHEDVICSADVLLDFLKEEKNSEIYLVLENIPEILNNHWEKNILEGKLSIEIYRENIFLCLFRKENNKFMLGYTTALNPEEVCNSNSVSILIEKSILFNFLDFCKNVSETFGDKNFEPDYIVSDKMGKFDFLITPTEIMIKDLVLPRELFDCEIFKKIKDSYLFLEDKKKHLIEVCFWENSRLFLKKTGENVCLKYNEMDAVIPQKLFINLLDTIFRYWIKGSLIPNP